MPHYHLKMPEPVYSLGNNIKLDDLVETFSTQQNQAYLIISFPTSCKKEAEALIDKIKADVDWMWKFAKLDNAAYQRAMNRSSE